MKPAPLPGHESTVARDPLDFNRTPAWVVELIVPLLGQPRTVLDVGCGDGAIGRVLRKHWPRARIDGVEIDPARHELASRAHDGRSSMVYSRPWRRDWITWSDWNSCYADGPPELFVSNVWFSNALRALEVALERVAPGGTVAFLLPTHWDHDADVERDFARQRFLDRLRLPDGREGYARFPIVGGGPNPARPSFKQKGTASDRYAWFLFGEQWAGHPGRRLHAIPPEVESGQLVLGGG